MTSKKKADAPKNGAPSPAKKPAKRGTVSPSPVTVDTEASAPAPSLSDTPESLAPVSDSPALPAPEDAAAALNVLNAAETALNAEPLAPVAPVPPSGGASDAEAALRDAAVQSAAGGEPPKRKGGWPRGRPRKPLSISAFAERAPGSVGPSPDKLDAAKLQARINELEAQQSEQVKFAMVAGFAQVAKIGFGIAARRNGVHWYLSDEEAEEIGAACGSAALPYISYIAPALPFIAAVGALYGAVSSRMEIDTEIEQGKRQRVMPGVVNVTA